MIFDTGNPLDKQRGGMHGLAEYAGDGTDTGSPSWVTNITGVVQSAVTAWNTQKIQEANIERAARGLPPLDAAAYAPQYSVGLSPDTKNLLILGGLALLAVVLLTKRGR